MLSWQQCRQPCHLPNLLELYGCTVRRVWVRPGLLRSEARHNSSPVSSVRQKGAKAFASPRDNS